MQGSCFGVFGEASDDVHNLLHEIVEERLKVAEQQSRRMKMWGIEAERAKLAGGFCQELSLLMVRANARNLENSVGQGCKEAACQ